MGGMGLDTIGTDYYENGIHHLLCTGVSDSKVLSDYTGFLLPQDGGGWS